MSNGIRMICYSEKNKNQLAHIKMSTSFVGTSLVYFF